MRRPIGMMTTIALCSSVAACGGSGISSRVAANGTSNRASNFSTRNNDRDNDGDHNDDDEKVLAFGHPARPIDHLAIVALVTHYFDAAATENGIRACSLLVPFIAESVAENNGHTPGLRGKTCVVVMSKLFKLHHRELVKKSAVLKVIAVRVHGDKALAVLDFPIIPEVRQITERRVGHNWRLLELVDGILE